MMGNKWAQWLSKEGVLVMNSRRAGYEGSLQPLVCRSASCNVYRSLYHQSTPDQWQSGLRPLVQATATADQSAVASTTSLPQRDWAIAMMALIYCTEPPPRGSGWIVGVSQLGNSSNALERSDPGGRYARAIVRSSGLFFSCPLYFFQNSLLSSYRLFQFLCLFFILALPVRMCWGQNLCTSSISYIDILNGTSLR